MFAVVVFLTMLACRQLASFLVGQALLGDQLNASLSAAALYATHLDPISRAAGCARSSVSKSSVHCRPIGRRSGPASGSSFGDPELVVPDPPPRIPEPGHLLGVSGVETIGPFVTAAPLGSHRFRATLLIDVATFTVSAALMA